MTKVYKWIKIGALLSFIPVIMAAGPLGGYFVADYLEKQFRFPHFTVIICIAVGFIASARETVKVIKMALKTERELR